MKRLYAVASVIICSFILSACSNTGTTYGTGTSHELATLKGISSMFELRAKDQAKIDYNARPDLVLPADKNSLPTPAEKASLDEQNWPVSPEQRQAAVQNSAPGDDFEGHSSRSSGSLPIEFALSEKEGISVDKRKSRKFDPAIDSTRASGASEHLRNLQKGTLKDTNKEVLARRQQLTYTKGSGARRFLTEPPSEYRTPAATAEAGDLGIDQSVLTEREKRQAQQDKDAERGIITPGSLN